jgi:lysophospholipase L1-like esterase
LTFMLRRTLSVIVAAVLGVTISVTPASADDSHAAPQYYLALGDSLAFGFQPNHDFAHGYVTQLYDRLHAGNPRLVLENLGCPGETSGTLVTGGICPYPGAASQLATALAFLRAHPGKVRLVTIDIGGNDVDHCVTAAGIDTACFARGLLNIAVNLSVTVARLRAAAPYAEFVGMTYYDTVLAAWLAGPAGQALAKQSLPLSHELNGLLALIYRFARFRVADVAAAFSTDDMTTMVNGLPLDVARICQWTWMCTAKPDIHANTAGYGVIADTFAAAL